MLLVLAGCGIAAVGVWQLLGRPGALVSVAIWFLVPVVLHDGLFAPAGITAGALGSRRLPSWLRTPVLGALLASAALVAVSASVIPVAAEKRAANPSLLDRDYVTGLLVALAIVWGVAAAVALARRGSHRQPGVAPQHQAPSPDS